MGINLNTGFYLGALIIIAFVLLVATGVCNPAFSVSAG